MHDYYQTIDAEIDQRIGTDVGWTALLNTHSYPMSAETVQTFRSRFQYIKTFQKQTLELFKRSLNDECDPIIARMIVGELPETWGLAYHRQLTEHQHQTPVFFRTDEVAPGQLSEIQCSGSAWGLTSQIQALYDHYPSNFGRPYHFPESLPKAVAAALRSYLGRDPYVHHLEDNASRPHGTRYFIQLLREQGIKFFSYDRKVGPKDCNFIRSHDFISLPTHNFFADRMLRCNQGEVFFDLPPSVLFDVKLIMAWPFWQKTRDAYTDETRGLFPYTTLIEPTGIELEDGEKLTIDQFCSRPKGLRDYYIKYAGTDINMNWGSQAVFAARTFSQQKMRELMQSILADWERDRYWILQAAGKTKDQVSILMRDGQVVDDECNAKFSGFYGPNGLMAILVMHQRSHKVHGSEKTSMSIVY
jgi:hypothetical protein